MDLDRNSFVLEENNQEVPNTENNKANTDSEVPASQIEQAYQNLENISPTENIISDNTEIKEVVNPTSAIDLERIQDMNEIQSEKEIDQNKENTNIIEANHKEESIRDSETNNANQDANIEQKQNNSADKEHILQNENNPESVDN